MCHVAGVPLLPRLGRCRLDHGVVGCSYPRLMVVRRKARPKRVALVVFVALVILPVVAIVVACVSDGRSCPEGEYLVRTGGVEYGGGGWVCVR